MKIRTDFVTNSSSASFIVYTIRSGEDEEKFEKLKGFINELMEKYDSVYMCASGDDGIWVKDDKITVTALEGNINNPIPLDTAIASYIGDDGPRVCDFLCGKSNIPLFDENGNMNKDVPTSINDDEAHKLCELLEGAEIDNDYIALFTD